MHRAFSTGEMFTQPYTRLKLVHIFKSKSLDVQQTALRLLIKKVVHLYRFELIMHLLSVLTGFELRFAAQVFILDSAFVHPEQNVKVAIGARKWSKFVVYPCGKL